MNAFQTITDTLRQGCVIPASPLALDSERRWDVARQRRLWRYYSQSQVGGIAIGVHTTQFAIRDVGLYRPLLELARDELDRLDQSRTHPLVRVAGICGRAPQAIEEADWAAQNGFHYGLVSLSAWQGATLEECVEHCRRVGEVLPVFGFYLQPAVGGIELPYRFWRALLELEPVAAIKVAAFDRYRTLDVVRAVIDSGRTDVALYTGNDDNIVPDLLQVYEFVRNGEIRRCRFVGGLLGQWACWTGRAVELLRRCHAFHRGECDFGEFQKWIVGLTDANAAIFDVANHFAGCIPGIHEVLRRQGLLEGTWCLDPAEQLSPGQTEEIDRVCREYPFLCEDRWVDEESGA